jgi:acyl carrier protein
VFYEKSNPMKVEKKVRSIVAELLGVETDQVTSETSLFVDLDADSLDRIEIIMALEEEFGLMLEKKEIKKIVKVNDIVQVVRCCSKEKEMKA